MIRLLHIFIDWPKKSASNFAIFARSIDYEGVSSSIIKVNDTYVSTASFDIEIK
jgi:hypothetical protein